MKNKKIIALMLGALSISPAFVMASSLTQSESKDSDTKQVQKHKNEDDSKKSTQEEN